MYFSPSGTPRRSVFAFRLRPLILLSCTGALGAFPAPVFSQGAGANRVAATGAVTVALQAFKVARTPDGREQLQSAARAKPGDLLEYRAVYANVSPKDVKNLQATLPIPASTEVLLDSVSPLGALASADGRTFAAAPLMRMVKMPNGTTQNRPLPLSAYRALRWPVGTLAAGKNVTVRARVRLNSNLAAR